MKLVKRWMSLLLTLALVLAAALPVCAAERSEKITVRVAFYPLEHFFEYDAAGKECGYGVDYLNELSDYVGIQWEYVPVESWESIGGLMADGVVDVQMPVSEPIVPSERYDYTVEPVMTSYHAIMTLASRDDLYYQDYEKFPTLKFAATKNLLNKTGVGDYLESIGVMEHLTFYPDYNSCRAALDGGEVDALISNVMDMTGEMKLLDRFNVVDNYITTVKGNPCYKLINNAMTQLKLENPSFQTELYERYFPDRAREPFTKTEYDYIAATDHLTVAVYPDRKPVSYLDADGRYRGIGIELADLVSERIGIPFEYIPVTTPTQAEMLDVADLVMPVPQHYDNERIFTTASMLDTQIILAVHDEVTELPDGARVGVLSTTPGIRDIMQGMPGYRIQEFPTTKSALHALQRGELDAVANASYVINWTLQSPRYTDLSTLRYQLYPISYNLCGRAEDTVLQSLLSKALRSITEEERDGIVQDGMLLNMDEYGFADWVYVYRRLLGVLVLLGALVAGFIFVYERSRDRYIQRIEESGRQQEKASRAKSEFLARMSHDMRTPLNVIMGMSHLAAENDNPPDTNDCLEKINISSEFLLGLINDVLDMEHIESGKMVLHLEPYSSKEFSGYIAAVIEPLCAQKNIHFRYSYSGPEDFVLLQDKMRINQVYFNLLSNAVKFTPEGGTVTFHTDVAEVGDGRMRLTVTVADTGIGMSPEFQKRMFEAFAQENQTFKPISEGTGLGLTIVKKICDLMGMTIQVESVRGSGTTFTLCGEFECAELPTAPEASADATPAPEGEEFLKGRTYLVCEDHPLNQEIIRRLLVKKGAVPVMAENGQRGLEAFEQSAPGSFAAILMDIRMPVMDGLQATRAIRALERPDAKTIPIYALTANAYEEDVKKCFDAGMNAHLAKPIDPAALYARLVAGR